MKKVLAVLVAFATKEEPVIAGWATTAAAAAITAVATKLGFHLSDALVAAITSAVAGGVGTLVTLLARSVVSPVKK
jgi:hypothetical protein